MGKRGRRLSLLPSLVLISSLFVVSCATLPDVKEPPPIEKGGIADEVVRLAIDIEEESLKVKLTTPKARTHYEKALDYIRRARLLVQETPHPIWDRSFLMDELDEIESQIRVLARRGVLDVWKRETSGEDPERLMVTEILSKSGIAQGSSEGRENRLYALYKERYSKYPLPERLLTLAEEVTEKERNYINLADIKGTPGGLMSRYLSEVKRNLEEIVKDRKATQEVDYRLYNRIESLMSYVRTVEKRFGAEVRESAVSLPPYKKGVFAEIEKLSREIDMVNSALKVERVKKDRGGSPQDEKKADLDELIEKARSWR